MLYFVQTFNTYSPKNRACKKLIDFVQKFERVLIKDELSLDALKEEIRIKVDEINAEHPKLKKIRFSASNIGGGAQRIDASVDNMGCSDYVFFMDICRIRSIYQFSERIAAAKKEIVTSGICRVCGCTENNPYFNPKGWVDDERTLCSRCADTGIKNDSETENCVNSKRK
jgi:hypothetical protein